MINTLLLGFNLWVWVQILGYGVVALALFLFARKINQLVKKVFPS